MAVLPAALLLALTGSATGLAARPQPSAVPGEFIVGLAGGVSDAEADRLLDSAGARVGRKLRRTRARLARIDPAKLDAALARLRRDPRVAYAEPNYRLHAFTTPNDPSLQQLWGLVNTGQTVAGAAGTPDADIDADEAWNVTTGSSSVVVGVIDTGVDFSHPDLAGNRWTNPGETGAGRDSNGVDDDGNGYVDDWRGWDFVNNDNNPHDDNEHGTHVAGTIGALGNNGVGVAGVNWNVRIMALKFLNADGGGDLADAVEAVRYATAMGARVTNNSWGGGGFSQALANSIAEADSRGSLFVAAAGNDGSDNDSFESYPASYDVPNVISVAATDQDDDPASFTNYGRTDVDLGAPGTNIYSTVPGGGYDWFDGTSMATPHVVGTAALAAAAFPGATGVGLKSLLLRTADGKAPLSDLVATGGRLNAARAVTCSGSPKAWLESPKPGFVARVNESVDIAVIGTNCAAPSGASVTATANGAPIALTHRGDGLYTGTYVPNSTAALTVTATASVGGLSDSRSASGTVDPYGLSEEPFSWIDATAGGTRLTLGDDTSASIPVPFAFQFFGQSFTNVAVSSNGYLVFGGSAATNYRNIGIPTTGAPNGFVAAYWDDLNPAAAGGVWHRTVGSAPNRRLVVSWVGVPHYNNAGTISFQIVLEETTDDIVLAYQDTLHNDPWYDHGASATIGIESLDATRGHEFSYDTAVLGPYQGTTSLRYGGGAPAPPDTTAPAPPTGLSATPGELSVSLAWAENTEADLAGYRVHRRAADGTWSRIATTTSPSYTDAGLAAGTAQTYRVTAFDRASPSNESAPSAEASATPAPDTTPPAVPTGLRATAGNAQVSLDWADNADAVADYRVYRDGAPIAIVTASAYADTGLANGTTYTYRVTARDQYGNESLPSTQVSATPQAPPPPPSGSYRVVEEPFSWIDPTTGGTRLTLGDDASASVALPFAFQFFGQSLTNVAVASNGYLVFGGSAATSYRNVAIPNSAAPNGLVAAYWDDLNPAAAGGVWRRTVGSAPNRKLVVSWVGVRHYTVPGTISFQIVLEETTNEIVLAYQDTLHDSASYNHGASATIGVENLAGSAGHLFSNNQARLGPYQATTSLRYTNR